MPKSNDPGNWYPVNKRIEDCMRDRNFPLPATDDVKALIAIDPGTTNLAACYMLRTPRVQMTRTTKFRIPKLDTTYQKIRYLSLAIEEWMGSLLGYVGQETYVPRIDLVIKESIAHGYAGGVADAGRVQHMIESLADRWSVPFIDVNPTSMRAFLGSKSKSDTKLAVYKKYHAEFPSEDECDVFAIAMTGLAIMSGEYKPKKKT